MMPPRWVPASDILGAGRPELARRSLHEALRSGLDPSADPPRLGPTTGSGQLLVMPSTGPTASGVKLATVAPGNPERGLERIQALYVLFDAATLTPHTLLDGTALTALRTPAVSAVALDLLAPTAARRLVVFGAGPQAIAHVEALGLVRPITDVTVVARTVTSAQHAVRGIEQLALAGLEQVRALAADDLDAVERATRAADLVVAATSAGEPVLNAQWVRPGTGVVAVGSHEPDRRELPAQLLGDAFVVVEDLATAQREAGDVVLAVAEGALGWSDVHELADLVRGTVAAPPGVTTVFKSVGMAWQDLVVAEAVVQAIG